MTTATQNRRVYLDTSVISALFDERSVERQRMTLDFWKSLHQQKVFISTLTQNEIEAAPDQLRTKLTEKLIGFSVLPVTPEAEELAQEYIEQGVFSDRYRSDALHVATAVFHRVEYLVSWNFAHLVKVQTRHRAWRAGPPGGKPAECFERIPRHRDYSASRVLTPPSALRYQPLRLTIFDFSWSLTSYDSRFTIYYSPPTLLPRPLVRSFAKQHNRDCREEDFEVEQE
jgi:predicted nucleic acid-binding protein